MATRILVAITEGERLDFFPSPLWDELMSLEGEVQWVDPLPFNAASWKTFLKKNRPEVLVLCWKSPPLPEELINEPEYALQYVCYLAGSIRKHVPNSWVERGLLVTNWGQSISRVVAEAGLLLILVTMRRSSYWAIEMRQKGGWKDDSTVTLSLFEKRVGLHGFGRISQQLTRLLKPFGVTVSTFSPRVPDSLLDEFEVRRAYTLEELFSDNEVIVELAALTPKTRHLVTEDLLRSIPKGGSFVNIGRGAVVDEGALIRVAREGNLQIALDVFEKEPLAPDSELRRLENITLLPHLGGPTTDRKQDAGKHALRNLNNYLRGEALEAVISPEIFERTT